MRLHQMWCAKRSSAGVSQNVPAGRCVHVLEHVSYCDGNYKESTITHSYEDEGDDLPEKRTGKGLFAWAPDTGGWYIHILSSEHEPLSPNRVPAATFFFGEMPEMQMRRILRFFSDFFSFQIKLRPVCTRPLFLVPQCPSAPEYVDHIDRTSSWTRATHKKEGFTQHAKSHGVRVALTAASLCLDLFLLITHEGTSLQTAGSRSLTSYLADVPMCHQDFSSWTNPSH